MAEKVRAQELFHIFSMLMEGGNALTKQLFKDPFPKRYKTYMAAPGKPPIIIEVKPDGVVLETDLKVVASEIVKYCREMDPDHGEHTINYMFDEGKALRVATYWYLAQTPIEPQEVASVRFLSEVGLTWHRTDFDPQDIPTPLFANFRSHILENEFACLAWIGSLFDLKAARQNYLWLRGEGGDGKGVLMRLLKKIFGPSYVAMATDVKNNQFSNSILIGKRLGGFSDCHNLNYVMSENFMQLSGGDPVRIEQKGKDGYTADINTMFMFSSNNMPNITSSKAHMRRAVIVELKERTEDCGDPRTYETRFYEERAGIVWQAMKAWKEMIDLHGKMVVNNSVGEQVADDFEDKYLSILEKFFVVKMHDSGGDTCSSIYELLRTQAKLNDFEIHHFKAYLNRKGIKILRKQDEGDRRRIYKGLYIVQQRF